jgi:hypothetical protein
MDSDHVGCGDDDRLAADKRLLGFIVPVAAKSGWLRSNPLMEQGAARGCPHPFSEEEMTRVRHLARKNRVATWGGGGLAHGAIPSGSAPVGGKADPRAVSPAAQL